MDSRLELVKANISTYPDFPKPGISFKDLFGVLRNPEAQSALVDLIKEKARSLKGQIDYVVGLDARGFLFGVIMADEIKVPFVPIRKKGKLPGECRGTDYALEYGTASVEMQKDAIQKDKNVLIVDDLIATGGTLAAAVKLIQESGATVKECYVIMELSFLKGREKLPGNPKVTSLVTYDDE